MSKNNDTYLLGQSIGLDEAAAVLREEAKTAWINDRHKEADTLAALAKNIQKLADERYKHPNPFAVRKDEKL